MQYCLKTELFVKDWLCIEFANLQSLKMATCERLNYFSQNNFHEQIDLLLHLNRI